MAGSYKHVVNADGTFHGVSLLDHLGDAYEALEEMYGMVWYLADSLAGRYAGEQHRPAEAADLVEEARQNYTVGIERSPGLNVMELDE
jgi:hypothetical protein